MMENEKESICGLNFLKEKLYNGIYADRLDCIDSAIYALEEIQQYREIGASPERLKELIFEGSAAKRILRHYQEIGTVEECREAVEKQEPKKPEVSDSDFDYYKCPVCGAYIWATDCVQDHNYCLNCGQAIDWEESEE